MHTSAGNSFTSPTFIGSNSLVIVRFLGISFVYLIVNV
nr:MAG TPA: hypothetical protein [Caudoviricetes sp.]